eukprot:FR740237.1.p1 GENE.FR740237.1~~FR740237.1.p1  ORF type:complete len:153 (+),score=7.21 FR740237.1:29-487(+)
MMDPSFLIAYPVGVVACFSATLLIAETTLTTALTATEGKRFFMSFSVLHCIKGSPDLYDPGTFNGHRARREQIDGSYPCTGMIKYLMMEPTLMLIVALIGSEHYMTEFVMLVPLCIFLMIAKMPQMHRVRLLHINATPGINDSMDTIGKKNS